MSIKDDVRARIDSVPPLIRAAFILRRVLFIVAIGVNGFVLYWTFASNKDLSTFVPSQGAVKDVVLWSGHSRNLLAYGFMATGYLLAFPQVLAFRLAVAVNAMAVVFEFLQKLSTVHDFSYLDMVNSTIGIWLAYFAVAGLKFLYWKYVIKHSEPVGRNRASSVET